jgi:hypothetical protein
VAVEPKELYGVKICALTFLQKACTILMENESIDQEHSNLNLIANIVSRSSFLSRTKEILQDTQLPPMFVAAFTRFITLTIQVDFKKSLPVLTQLDMWTIIISLLNPDTLRSSYQNDRREILSKGKNSLLQEYKFFDEKSSFIIDMTAIVTCMLESVKKEPQLCGMFIHNTTLIEKLCKLIHCIVREDFSLISLEGITQQLCTLMTYLIYN